MFGAPLQHSTRTGRGRRPFRSLVGAACFVLAGSALLAGCGGDDTEEPAGSPDAQNTADGSTLSGRWPLTGLPAEGEAPEHPVVVVKIDNTVASRPQVGLGAADMVVEELVEGGSTRLAAFFYSKLPDQVGPVRSIRATDIGIVRPANAVIVASGGAPRTMQRVKKAGIRVITEGGPGYSRDSGRQAPYNLMMQLPSLAKTLKAGDPPPSYFSWGAAEDFPGGQKARTVTATFSGGHSTTWEFRKGSYVDVESNAAARDQYAPETVLVLRVKVGDAGYRDPAGNPVPETKFTGKGAALVFHGGSVVRGTWSKKGLDAPVTLKTRAGELELPPGNVWVGLVPQNGGGVTFRK